MDISNPYGIFFEMHGRKITLPKSNTGLLAERPALPCSSVEAIFSDFVGAGRNLDFHY